MLALGTLQALQGNLFHVKIYVAMCYEHSPSNPKEKSSNANPQD